jgi:hypothetical protein
MRKRAYGSACRSLDHVLVSQALEPLHRHADILNDTLLDQYFAWLRDLQPYDSFHAPVVADVDLPAA